MESIIVFFRDILSGNLYIVISIICSIFIFLCILLLIFRNKKLKEEEKKFLTSHVIMLDENGEEKFVNISKNVESSPVDSNLVNNKVLNVKDNTSKSTVIINPQEVASVSSTLNVINGSSVKSSLSNSNGLGKIDSLQNVQKSQIENVDLSKNVVTENLSDNSNYMNIKWKY